MHSMLLMVAALSCVQPAFDGAEPYRQKYRQILRENQPAMGPEVYSLIDRAATRLKEITAEVLAASFPDAKPEQVDLQALSREGATPSEKEIARAVLLAAMKSDVPRLTAQLYKAARIDRKMDDALLLEQKLPGLGQARQIARFQSGRMTLALEAGDADQWLAAYTETLRMGHQVAMEPTLISALVGIAIQASALDGAQRMIVSPQVTDGLLAGTLARLLDHPAPTIERALRGERLLGEDSLDYVYAVGAAGMERIGALDGRAPKRPAQRAIPDGQALGPGMPAREDHLKMLSEAYDALDRLAQRPSSERRGAPEVQIIEDVCRKSLLAKMLLPSVERAANAADQLKADRMGVFVQAALERRRLNRGSYPETLAEIAADLGNIAPTDPYTGMPLGYLPPSRGPYEGGRAFVLYAAGLDGVDDGGKVNFAEPFAANTAGAAGVDLLLNRYAKPK